MLVLLFLFVGACALNIREEEIEHLERFGYIDNSGPAAQRTEQFLQERIREFQEMAALPMTGEMDEATRRMMKTPRCGRKDIVGKDKDRLVVKLPFPVPSLAALLKT
uniref:PG_binding_1 domain-containing protein n=1 Tax=Steinernema glaseri TaxID=37863 RepID=A0A1I7ZSU4_9BILA